jgi:hypothetical protein
VQPSKISQLLLRESSCRSFGSQVPCKSQTRRFVGFPSSFHGRGGCVHAYFGSTDFK